MKNEIRRVIFPINLKLTFVVLSITAVSLSSYIWLALDLFKTDKVAYVFEAVEKQNEQISQLIAKSFEEISFAHQLLLEGKDFSKIRSKIFSTNESILGHIEFRKGKNQYSYFKGREIIVPPEVFRTGNIKTGIRGFKLGNKRYFVHFINIGELKSFVIFSSAQIKDIISESKLYSYKVMLNNEVLIGSRQKFWDGEFDLVGHHFQTFTSDFQGEKYIVSIIPTMGESIVSITGINYNKALAASTKLRNTSLYFGFLVAGIVIILILLFSAVMTKSIKKLYLGSIELAKTNFSYRVKLKQRDEIGVLGDSFNDMAGKIQVYMEEMKEKARLENELNTAKLVQKSFFPTNRIDGKNMALKAYYQPASECGGDWWGYLNIGKVDIVILLDVTGHGTAAALMTAVIHNALTAIKYITEQDPSFAQDSAKIMQFLNDSMCSVDIDLNATAFVAVFEVGRLNYCNASHNPPYFVKNTGSEIYKKNEFVPLMEKIGSRLGENKESQYESVIVDYGPRDYMVLYTDGIVEATNLEGKQFGTRNFIKNLGGNLSLGFEKSLDALIKSFYEFVEGNEPDDDISVLRVDLK